MSQRETEVAPPVGFSPDILRKLSELETVVGAAIHAIVKAVNQQTEVDALRRLGLVRLDRSGGARAGIGVRRIVAEHAEFGLIPPVSVQSEVHVALIAVGFAHQGAAGRSR